MGDVTLESLMNSITDMKQSFERSIDKVNSRMDDLNRQSRSNTRTPSPRPKSRPRAESLTAGARPNPPSEWYLRTDTVLDISPDADFGWEDHEEPECSPTSKLSEETESILNRAMTAPLSTTERREIRGRYPIPATTLTRTPKVDEIFTSSESRFPKNTDAKAIEKDLSHISTCTLDAVRPLLDLIEGVNSGEFTPEDVKIKAVDTLRLLGNAVAHTSTIRRKRILKVCNPDIVSLADNRELFEDAAPSLFGKGFETKMKDRAEALKVLHKGQSTTQYTRKIFFRGSRPPTYPPRGGGYGYRGGRGGNRYTPYNRQTYATVAAKPPNSYRGKN